MTVHVEWMSDPSVSLVPAGTEIGGYNTDTDAIVIEADSVLVIEGDIEAFAERVRRLVEGGES